MRVRDVWARTNDDNDTTEGTASFRVYYTPPRRAGDEGGNGVVFVCVHGAGYSGLSFAELARQLIEQAKGDEEGAQGEENARVGVLAYDARGHGEPTPFFFGSLAVRVRN